MIYEKLIDYIVENGKYDEYNRDGVGQYKLLAYVDSFVYELRAVTVEDTVGSSPFLDENIHLYMPKFNKKTTIKPFADTEYNSLGELLTEIKGKIEAEMQAEKSLKEKEQEAFNQFMEGIEVL